MISKAQCPYLQRASRRYAFFFLSYDMPLFFFVIIHFNRPLYSKLIGYLEDNLLADQTASILITLPN